MDFAPPDLPLVPGLLSSCWEGLE